MLGDKKKSHPRAAARNKTNQNEMKWKQLSPTTVKTGKANVFDLLFLFFFNIFGWKKIIFQIEFYIRNLLFFLFKFKQKEKENDNEKREKGNIKRGRGREKERRRIIGNTKLWMFNPLFFLPLFSFIYGIKSIGISGFYATVKEENITFLYLKKETKLWWVENRWFEHF